ncbi:MAG: dynamin family protein, partial [Romboutsia sp.]|nr:dynamin family protein [Romboutsia sp.]
MENINQYINEIKESLLSSPIREKLSQKEIIPFKDTVFEELNKQIENINALEYITYKPLNISIVGEVKSGKSSLLNALLGEEISEVDVLEATSSVIEVVYGENRDVSKFKDITRISLDIDYLKKINIVDTPGLKSITQNNEDKTIDYIKYTDLILFVIDATHLGQEDTIEALELISEYNKPIIGVINKCDLLSENRSEILDYITSEYGIYIDRFFMISSYLEYQHKISQQSVAKTTDLIISNYTELRENFKKLTSYIEGIYQNSNNIKYKSIKTSIEGIIQKDIIAHSDYNKSIDALLSELKKYEKLLKNKKDYIKAKMEFEINDWIDRFFLSDEVEKIENDIKSANVYINESYLTDLINLKKNELDDLYFKEWSVCLKEISDEMDDDIKRYVNDITYKNELLNTPTFKLNSEKTDINVILATIGTGAILGATSGGVISIYSVTLGSYSASLTLSAAIMSYLPPFLIAGTISGAVGKIIYDKVLDDRKNKEILNNIE